jgi:folate-binding protein YgfZ
MSNWTDYLAARGARFYPQAGDEVADFGRTLAPAVLAAGFVAPLRNLGLIGVRGEDAARFLHSQLTNDVEHLGAGDVRLAGFCTPKGRLQASFLMWRAADDSIMLQLPRAIQAPLQKRLAMFVMRAKAALRDATGEADHAAVLGVGGAAGGAALQALGLALPPAPYTCTHNAQGTLLRLADALGAARWLWLTHADAAQAAWPALSTQLASGGQDAWQLAAIHAGIPQIEAGTQEQFVPQMINYELLGGVNFKKGCYPGQEIVARSQYLGTPKRRMVLARVAHQAPAQIASGTELFAAADPGQPCGMVVNAAPNGEQGADLLVEIKLAVLGTEGARPVFLGTPAGPALQFLPMPYALDALAL